MKKGQGLWYTEYLDDNHFAANWFGVVGIAGLWRNALIQIHLKGWTGSQMPKYLSGHLSTMEI